MTMTKMRSVWGQRVRTSATDKIWIAALSEPKPGSAEVYDEKREDGPTGHQLITEATEKPVITETIEEMVPVPIEMPQEDDIWGMSSLGAQKKNKREEEEITPNRGYQFCTRHCKF